MSGKVNTTGAVSGIIGTTVGTPSGGKVVQVVQSTASDLYTYTTNTFGSVMTNPTLTITLTDNTNKLLILCHVHRAMPSNVYLYFDLKRVISGGATTSNLSGETEGLARFGGPLYTSNWSDPIAFNYLDSPGTDSELTYQITFRNNDGITAVQGGNNDGLTTITGLEIDA